MLRNFKDGVMSFLGASSEADGTKSGSDSDSAMEPVPQSEPTEASQVPNSAGGFSWQVSDLDQLRRFLVLGCEGGTYYACEKDLKDMNVAVIDKMIKENRGIEVVGLVKQYSVEGRTAKQDSILLALAICTRQDDKATKSAAYAALPEICRIPTHLFQFIEYAEKKSKDGTGWGRAHRKAICKWYNSFKKNPKRLAMHVTKYRNRNGWTHRDVFRLSHPKPESDAIGSIVKYVIKGLETAKKDYSSDTSAEDTIAVLEFLSAVEKAKDSNSEDEVVELIKKFGLVREHVPTALLNSVSVWGALLKDMPMTALIRNLNKMTAVGLVGIGREETKLVTDKLLNQDLLKKARIHPLNVLVAMNTYKRGSGEKGKLTWLPDQSIVSSLEEAFYLSFKFVEPTNKRHLLAVDVSGSMSCAISGTVGISCATASACLSMVTARTESNFEVVAFSHKLTSVNITQRMTLNQVTKTFNRIRMGGTDCALPMTWAAQNKKKFDVFVVYTDSETWFGNIHPAEALRQYRIKSGIWDAKLIVCGMAANQFTIADPSDPGMLDMVGFDSAGPEIMRNFTLGQL
ncbi:RNA-binding protein Ro60-like [Lineus longissimus]|uniref:RNA-binding protein Ro60-like n=1 Tax=Lineus longissimus TaxID=88925 RepID=UPI00315D7EA6